MLHSKLYAMTYELFNIQNHAESAVTWKKMQVMAEEASVGDESNKYELSIVKLKYFNVGHNACFKLLGKMNSMKDVSKKLEVLKGVTRGLDMHIFVAITGPRAGHYNGKHGETRLEVNSELAFT